MTATTTDRLDGLASSTAIKGPCKAASTTNLTLSGEQTVNGVSIVADDRVLVTGQTDGTENGIYVASTGAWRRAKDFSSNNDVREGTQVRVSRGTYAGLWVVTNTTAITFDTTSITISADPTVVPAANLATTIHAATSKTTPVDADELGLWDSVALALKKLTWENLKTTLASTFLPLAGGTMTGNLTVTKASPDVVINKAAAGQANRLLGYTNGVARWAMTLGSTADESGADAGSELTFNAYTDAGAFIDFPLIIYRAAGGLVVSTRGIRSSSATGAIGYATGAGGAVTQATSKATGVTLNKASGQITMNNAALGAGTIVSFVLTDSAIAAGDVLVLNHISGGTPGSYTLNARCAAGSATIDVRNNTAGSLSEAIVIAFAVIKAVAA